uniref:Major facilitator superfamily (MFS) profile domain-containing protein n=1 Tax=Alexandrium catenella TaxID=2925 RepID=A0A7S1QWW6_ALECA
MVCSPLAVKAMSRYGRAPVLFFGLLVQGITSITFGYADELTGGEGVDRGSALVVYTLSRLACGAGAACANNAVFSIAADRFPDSLASVMGLNEVVIGAGFSLGPPIGTMLNLRYGFNIVFLISGSAVLIFAPVSLLCWQPHPRSGSSEDAAREDSTGCGSFREVLTPGLLCAGFSLLLGTGTFGIVEPILGLYLSHEVGVSPAGVGVVFCIFAVAYSLAGPLAGWLADRLGALRVCACGSLGAGLVCLVLLGPTARWLAKGTPERISYEVAALVVLGIFQAATLIPSLPAMKDSVPLSSSTLSSSGVTERVVAWFNIFMQTGLVIAPLLGTALRDGIGFEATVAIFGSGVAVYGAAALSFACRRGKQPLVAESVPGHLITGVAVSPMSRRQRDFLPEKVLRKISY